MTELGELNSLSLSLEECGGGMVWGRAEGEEERESQADSTPSTQPEAGLDLTALRS